MTTAGPDAPESGLALDDPITGGRTATARPARGRRGVVVVAVIVGAATIWQLATVRPGHPWGDDFAMYIMEARNIATFHSYTDTGFIYNPARPTYAPRAYPPGYPLVLAPVYRLFGLHFTPMKVEVVLLLVGAVFLLGLLAADDLPLPSLAFFLILVGFAPKFSEFKNDVLSDLPGLFFVALVLVLAQRQREWRLAARSPTLYGAILGVAMYMAYATRTLAIVAVAAVVAGELLTRRRLSRPVLVGVGVFVVLAAVQTLLLGSTLSYFNALHPTFGTMAQNLRRYPGSLISLWPIGRSIIVAILLLWATGALALVGFVVRAKRRGMDSVAWFPVLYPIPLVIWPVFGSVRYLIPWIPFFMFFVVVGVAWIGEQVRSREALAPISLAVVAAVLLASYGWRLAIASYGAYRQVDSPAAMATFDFIRTQTPTSAILIVEKPRAFALFTGRRASELTKDPPPSAAASLAYAERIHATYLVIGPWQRRTYQRLFDAYSDRFRLVFRTKYFEVLQLLEA
jgi:hypothetical protein